VAYTKELHTTCDGNGCTKKASVEVFNDRNASIGKFCKSCGHRALIRTMKAEKETRG
jgi:rRNA maturation endonuclease Nob1